MTDGTQWQFQESFEHNSYDCTDVHLDLDHREWLTSDAFGEFWKAESTEAKQYQHAVAYSGQSPNWPANDRRVKRYTPKPCREIHAGNHAEWVRSRANVVRHWEQTESTYREKERNSFLLAVMGLVGFFAIAIIINQSCN